MHHHLRPLRLLLVTSFLVGLAACATRDPKASTPASQSAAPAPAPAARPADRPAEARPAEARPAPAPGSIIDCAKPKPRLLCCTKDAAQCADCTRRGELLAKAYDLKCVQKVPRSYRACGCGCCGGIKPGPKTCLYFSRGDDIRTIIANDRKSRSATRCALVGCALGRSYEYCD